MCFDVVATDDVELEQSEFVSFIIIIDTAINTTVARSMTTITVLDNDSKYISNANRKKQVTQKCYEINVTESIEWKSMYITVTYICVCGWI